MKKLFLLTLLTVFLSIPMHLFAYEQIGQLNPYAYGVGSTARNNKIAVSYQLNAPADSTVIAIYCDGVEVGQQKVMDSSLGLHSVVVDLASYSQDGTYTIGIRTYKQSYEAPFQLKEILDGRTDTTAVHYAFYHPKGVDIDRNPFSPYFGRILTDEGMEDTPDWGYISSTDKDGIYAFDASFLPITNGNNYGFRGNYDFSVRMSNGTSRAYAPYRIRISDDGRIFTTMQDDRYSTLYELSQDLQSWTPIFTGTFTDGVMYDADGNYVTSINCGFEVQGSGEDLKIIMLNGSYNTMTSYNCADLFLATYNLGTATSWSGAPTTLDTLSFLGENTVAVMNTSGIAVDDHGGFWYHCGRANMIDQRGLCHVNANKQVDFEFHATAADTAKYHIIPNGSNGGAGCRIIKMNGEDYLFVGMGRNISGHGHMMTYKIIYDAIGGVADLEVVYDEHFMGISTNLNDFAVDYANNLYTVGNSNEKIIPIALPYSGMVETPVSASVIKTNGSVTPTANLEVCTLNSAKLANISGQSLDVKTYTSDAVPAGTVFHNGTNMKVTLPFAQQLQWVSAVQPNGAHRKIAIGSTEISMEEGIQGKDNPKDWDGDNPCNTLVAPVQGACYEIEAKTDGWVVVLLKASSNKQYFVFENGTFLGYKFGMMTYASPSLGENGLLQYQLNGDPEYNYLTAATVEQYTGYPKIEFVENYVNIDTISSGISPGQYKQNGVAAIVFQAYTNCHYLVGGAGTKMIASAIVFVDENDELPIVAKGETVYPEYGDVLTYQDVTLTTVPAQETTPVNPPVPTYTLYYCNNNSNSNFAVWYWGEGSEGAWTPWMTPVSGHIGWYEVNVPTNCTNVIFAQFNSSASSPDWTYGPAQTADLAYDGQNAYYVEGRGWQNSFTIIDEPIVISDPYPISIDGDFSDWNSAPSSAVAQASADWNAAQEDLYNMKWTSDDQYIAFYMEFNSDRNLINVLEIMLDTDGNSSTGYDAWPWANAGADYIVEGWVDDMNSSGLYKHNDPNHRDSWAWADVSVSNFVNCSAPTVLPNGHTALEGVIRKSEFPSTIQALKVGVLAVNNVWTERGVLPQITANVDGSTTKSPMLAVPVFYGQMITANLPGEHITWSLQDSVLTISGSGAMANYNTSPNYLNAPWAEYSNSIKTIVIGDSVTSIGNSSFRNCYNLTSVVIPNSITSIGNYAFYSCQQLSSVLIPSSVTSIGHYAFSYCNSLTSVTIPDDVSFIGEGAFNNVYNIVYHGTAEGATWGAWNMNLIVEAPFIFSQDRQTLLKCMRSATGAVVVPAGVKKITGGAFNTCEEITSILVPNSVDTIGGETFMYCTKLASLTIPSHTVIDSESGTELYQLIALTDITAPATMFNLYHNYNHVYSLSSGYPHHLQHVVVNSGELDGGAFDVLKLSNASLKTLDLSGVTNTVLPEDALTNCHNLTTLLLPAGLERLEYLALAECVNLTQLVIPAPVQEIGDRALENCRHLTSVTFAGTSLTRIGHWAFYNAHLLQNITIPQGVTEIGDAAFYGCNYLSNVSMPATVSQIGDYAFAGCSRMTRMHVDAAIPPTVAAWTFDEVSRVIPVYVPDASVNTYKADPIWGQLNIVGQSQEGTALDNLGSESTLPHKLLENGQIYIIRPDGTRYTATGQKVR